MPIEVGVWKLGERATRLTTAKLAEESRLEDYIVGDASLVRDDLWIIGRQVATDHGGFIDLLGMDPLGNLVVLELKRDRTPREVVAQVLDYASWIRGVGRAEIESIFEAFERKKGRPVPASFDEAFVARFGGQVPEVLNDSHELIVVAAALDDSTERIIQYLGEFGVPVNAVFFRVFADGDRSYMTRAWLQDPTEAQTKTEEVQARQKGKEPWNGNDFYVSFGGRDWEDAREFGFVSAGGGRWYSRTLDQLAPGNRVFVHIPGTGYTGIGEVLDKAVPVERFGIAAPDGKQMLISEAKLRSRVVLEHLGNPEKTEVMVRVRWLKTVAEAEAVWEPGFFANQNTVCKLRSRFTIERLTQHFGLSAQG